MRARLGAVDQVRVLTGAILLVGGLVTAGVFLLARNYVCHDFLRDFREEGSAQMADISNYLNARLVFLDDLARHLELSPGPDPETFRAFVATERRRVSGIQALEWAPLVRSAGRAGAEAGLRAGHPDCRGFTERDAAGTLRSAAVRSCYYPVTFLEPLAGNRPALGYDLGSNPARLAAIEAARDTGQPRATAPVTLVQETQSQAGFLVFAPVYQKGLPTGTLAQRRAAFQGVVLGVFRTGDLLAAVLDGHPTRRLPGELNDLDAPWNQGPIHAWRGLPGRPNRSKAWLGLALLGGKAPISRHRIGFAGRTWEAAFRADPVYLGENLPQWVWHILPGGLTLAGLLACLFHLVNRGKERAEALVLERTQALGASLALLEAREDELRLILDSTAEGLYGLDLEGRCTFCNRALARMLGRPDPAGLVGLNMHRVTHHTRADGTPYPEADCQIFKAFREGRGTHADREVLWRADGTSFPAEYWSYPQWREGRVVGAVVTVIDISERILAERHNAKLQAQYQQAQKMESLGSLAGGVAHDMNNVLAAILGFASANVELQPPGSQSRRAFEIIGKAANRGAALVKGLLSFSRRSAAEARELDLNTLLAEEILLLERTTLAKVRMNLDLAPDLGLVRGDGDALTHAFMNLFINAVDAMAGGGTLTLRTRNLGGDWVEVRVEDTGEGMPPEVLERAFDPFFTTKAQGKGTGLGLAMVYSTLKAHQGLIELHSTPGEGTQVRVRFPRVAPGAADPGLPPEAHAALERRSLTVLVVDDDELVQASMVSSLELLGHTHALAATGEAALAAVEAGLDPEVVILDMNMPGLGGAGTLPLLRALKPGLPVLLCTGRVDQAALDLIQAHRGVRLLPKPFPAQDLDLALQAITARRAAVRY